MGLLTVIFELEEPGEYVYSDGVERKTLRWLVLSPRPLCDLGQAEWGQLKVDESNSAGLDVHLCNCAAISWIFQSHSGGGDWLHLIPFASKLILLALWQGGHSEKMEKGWPVCLLGTNFLKCLVLSWWKSSGLQTKTKNQTKPNRNPTSEALQPFDEKLIASTRHPPLLKDSFRWTDQGSGLQASWQVWGPILPPYKN